MNLKKYFSKSLKAKLIAWFLIVSVIPITIVGVLGYDSAKNRLEKNAFNNLTAIGTIKLKQLSNYFSERKGDIDVLSKIPAIYECISKLETAHEASGMGIEAFVKTAKYQKIVQSMDPFLKNYKEKYGYNDIFVIEPNGDILYTVIHEADFGTNILTGPYKNSSLAKAVKSAQQKGGISFADYQSYAPSNNEPAAFMANVIYDYKGELHGFVALQISIDQINAIMQERTGLGETGETYLVSTDYLMRSDSRFETESTILRKKVETKSVKLGLQDKSGTHVIPDYRGISVLSFYSQVGLNEKFDCDFDWVLLSEIDEKEAFAPVKELRNRSIIIALIVALLVALLVAALAYFISRSLSRPIRKMSEIAKSIAVGDLEQNIKVTQKDEIGELANSINEIVTNFQEVVRQADGISSGDYTATIKPRSAQDKLSIALQQMTRTLKEKSEQTEKQIWMSDTRSNLNDVISGDPDIIKLSRNVITLLVKQLDTQIGAIYLTDEDEKELKLTASYAFSKRKNLNTTIKFGEGLVGQAAFEKELISLSNIPDDYIRINSALGDAVPKNIIVSPFIFDEKVIGVIELGSIREFTEEHLELLKTVMITIAICVKSALARDRMKELLVKTQQQAEELQTQQEELRVTNEELEQQTEELKASQEKLKGQQEELQATNEELEEKTEYLEKQSEEIKEKNRDLEKVRQEIERKAEELEISSKYKSEFMANMSHELRTPLNSLLLLARNLAENKVDTLNDDQVESAEIIYQSGNDLLTLINEILDLSKIESGKMILNIESFKIEEIAENLNCYFRHMAGEKGLSFEINTAKELPPAIHSDRQRVEQVIKNLVSNALKFTSAGGVTVEFFCPDPSVDLSRSGLDAQQALGISVTDTGIGIPEEKQLEIFEAFQQADGSTSRQYGGTGLGLSISRELAKLLGGEIQLVSAPGKGSTFTLYIRQDLPGESVPHSAPVQRSSQPRNPVPAPPETAPAAAVIPSPAIKDDRDNLNENDQVLLVIEDDLKFARVLYQFAHEKNFKCLHTGDGETGLEFALKYKPDAIILDINLPGIEGWGVLEALKDNSATRHIPVHMMSVDDETIDAFRKGAIGYLTKPVTQKDLDKAFTKIEDVIAKEIKEVLIVEDDENTQKGIMKLLGSDEINQTVVSLGKEAVQKVQSGSYDCMILDLSLPDISGFDVLDELSHSDSDATPPVIVYTGKELTREEEAELQKYTGSIVVKGVRSEERLLDETALFLHRVVDKFPARKKKIISKLHEGDSLFKDKKILLVDDDTRNIFAISKILQEKGMDVHKAANGQKALEGLEKNGDIDLVLMDIMMPVMDGYEAMGRIREQERFRNLPILALTAKAMKDDRDKCIAAGANDYLPKPVDIDRLLSLMRVWLYK